MKDKYEYHCLIGEKLIPSGRKVGNEEIMFLPDMFIPEVNVPIELTSDKDRDNIYMKNGYLPMVIVKENLKVDVNMYIDIFLDFHKKWREQKI